MNRFAGTLGTSSRSRVLRLEKALARLRSEHAATLAENERLRALQTDAAPSVETRQASDLTELFDMLGDEVFALPGIDGCAICLANETNDALVTAYLRLPEQFAGVQKAYRGFHHQIDQPDVNVTVFKSAEPIHVSAANRADFGDITRRRFESMAMRSLLVVPMILAQPGGAETTIGVLSVFSQQADFDSKTADSLMSIARGAAPRIQGLWMRQQLIEWGRAVRDMHAEIQQHIAFITAMNSVVSVEQIHALIGQRVLRRFRFDIVAILMAEGNELAIEHVDFSERHGGLRTSFEKFRQSTRYSINPPDAACAVVFANNQRFLFDDVQQIAHLPMSEKDRASLNLLGALRTSLLVPIRFDQVPIGILWLGTLEEPIAMADSDLALIELLGSYVSTAIRNAQAHGLIEQQKDRIELLNQELRSKVELLDRMAHKDRLTGLNNYGRFEEELKRKTAERQRGIEQEPLSAIILDVDHFKRFNDAYGHPAGNQVLQEFAARVLKSVREVDFVARYGGEEFVVLLPQCEVMEAARIAERIRTEVGKLHFIVDGCERAITVSGGCGEFAGNEGAVAFIRRVDAALYAAKEKGRDRIEIAEPPAQRETGTG